jgi:hypothetical protein
MKGRATYEEAARKARDTLVATIDDWPAFLDGMADAWEPTGAGTRYSARVRAAV